jgi:hypothetical protein
MLQLLAVGQDPFSGHFRRHPKALQRLQMGAHALQGLDRSRIDGARCRRGRAGRRRLRMPNVNVNRNTNVNVDVDRGGCCGGGWDNDYHPVATAAAVGAAVAVTSAVVGSMVRTVLAGCVPVNYGGMIYQQCGGTWYQPQGTQYVVINPPY